MAISFLIIPPDSREKKCMKHRFVSFSWLLAGRLFESLTHALFVCRYRSRCDTTNERRYWLIRLRIKTITTRQLTLLQLWRFLASLSSRCVSSSRNWWTTHSSSGCRCTSRIRVSALGGLPTTQTHIRFLLAPLSPEQSADLSMLFDIGGIVGAIATGVISDSTSMPASTCVGMLFIAAPLLSIYQTYGYLSYVINAMMLFVLGLFVNGPYALITTSVSAELGQHKSLQGNGKALATVTSIIDGTGSIGAAVGPLIAGLVQAGGWQNVFYMLISSNIIAMVLLFRLVRKEFSKLKRRRGNIRIE